MQVKTELKTLKVLFIQPSHIMDDGKVWKSKMPWLPRLALPHLAAITPDNVATKIIDEYIEDIDFNSDADLIALTSTTVQAPRAYQIADKFRSLGKTVIMGGIHPSLLPDEAKEHADSVIIGEADAIWSEVLADFARSSLKPIYTDENKVDITHLPPPKLNSLSLDKYKVIFKPIQTTRGCPHNCDYCSVTQFFGKSYRHRDIDEVVQEIKDLKSDDIFFVDDNIISNPKRAKELFKAITPLKLSWISQSTMSIVYDDELLELASQSGCKHLMLGLESLSSDSLASVNKKVNKVDDYYYAIDKLHRYGITVMGLMVFGFDHDDETVFEKTAKFMEDTKVDFPCYWILTPYPNTPLYHKLESEGRIIERDWSKYDCTHVVFQPKLMSPETLREGYMHVFRRAYSIPNIIKRAFDPMSPLMARRKYLEGGLPVILSQSLLFRYGIYNENHPMSG